jgi:LCP family protein required for cell wall assembly
VWSVTAAILIFLLASGASYLWFTGGLKSKRTGGLLSSPHKVNILVLGVDERADDVGRSDTMFAVTVDTETKDVSMLSIPRDTRVKIPGHGWDKINHAYAEGGAKLSQQAAEDLLGIPFDYYITINFAGFYKIIDAIGGVDVNVEKRMYYEDPYDNLRIDLRPGMQHMDGKTAIQYVRYRDEEGDIGRIQRQQKFIRAVMEQVASPSVIIKVPNIIKEVSSVVKTNMSTGDMLSLAKLINDANKKGLTTDMVPGRPAYIDDISYWLPDIEALRRHVAQIEGGVLEGKNLTDAREVAGAYQQSIPKEMKVLEVPKTLQTTKPATDAKSTDKTDATKTAKPPVPGKVTVSIVNASGNPAAGTKMAQTLKAQGIEVSDISNSGSVSANTIIVSYTTSSAVVNKLTGLPFKYVLQITKDDGRAVQAAVVIGKDYN